MAGGFPRQVTLNEVGPRDGFQFEPKMVPTRVKVDIISRLIAAGLRQIQVASFVNPKRVPQMADAEDVIKQLPDGKDVVYTALALNARGVERAAAAGIRHIEVSISASDTHGRKNSGMSVEQALKNVGEMVGPAKSAGMVVRGGVQCAFGCVYEGPVPRQRVHKMVEAYLELGVDGICLADTTGMANPLAIRKMMAELGPGPNSMPLTLHLHETRGLGLANVLAALECGVTSFDTSVGGMGGCPFVPGAAGNIATEDTAYMMASMQIETGINIPAIAAITERLEQFFDKQLPSRIGRVIRGCENYPASLIDIQTQNRSH